MCLAFSRSRSLGLGLTVLGLGVKVLNVCGSHEVKGTI